MKSVSIIILLCLFSGLLCLPVVGETSNKPLVDVIYSGGKGDHSFIDSAYRGLIQAAEKYSFTTQEYSILNASADPVPQLNGPEGETPAMVLLVGNPLTSMAQEIADSHPTLPVVALDSDSLVGNNTKTVVFPMYGSSYLAGIIAAGETRTGKVAVVAGRDNALMSEFIQGFSQGAVQSGKEVLVSTAYVADDNSGYWSPERAKEIARDLSANGTDVIFTVAGGSGMGVIEYARNTSGMKVIGVDSDQSVVGPEVVVASVLKNLDQVVYNEISSVIEGNFTPGVELSGLADNGSGIVFNPNFGNLSSLITDRFGEAAEAEDRYRS
ncbi:MAG TPA: BMP family ABC transporter substrate-binding protein [Methanospirillum sp.]|uniref:BMP family lipoprotein n=1 Tax=Methanospirillum sp. TaxID=45200 RepID=UPI002D097B1D|nr:BMP family ABC transporter substrate-binding protein [Methanospirillum sp.]HWQ63781.1 BMP family ABC transporter substrate-binding protein [Methanospirillum sp.]